LLQEAIVSTFNNRATSYIHEHSLFSPAFATDSLRKQNWAAFLRKIKRDKELTFEEVMQTITTKLKPYWENLKEK